MVIQTATMFHDGDEYNFNQVEEYSCLEHQSNIQQTLIPQQQQQTQHQRQHGQQQQNCFGVVPNISDIQFSSNHMGNIGRSELNNQHIQQQLQQQPQTYSRFEQGQHPQNQMSISPQHDTNHAFQFIPNIQEQYGSPLSQHFGSDSSMDYYKSTGPCDQMTNLNANNSCNVVPQVVQHKISSSFSSSPPSASYFEAPNNDVFGSSTSLSEISDCGYEVSDMHVPGSNTAPIAVNYQQQLFQPNQSIQQQMSSSNNLCSTPMKRGHLFSCCYSRYPEEFHNEQEYKEKRRKNNEASRRSRIARRYKECKIMEEIEKLRKENENLRTQINILKGNNENIKPNEKESNHGSIEEEKNVRV